MNLADDVLPSEPVRSPFAHGALIFLTLRDELTRDQAIEFFTGLTAGVREATTDFDGHRLASITTALGAGFFQLNGQPRFELDPEQIPTDLRTLPVLPPECVPVTSDVVLYVITTAEATLAQFLLRLGALRAYIKTAEIERGFQRSNRRELGGFLDGLRNANTNRNSTVFVDRDDTDEPVWADGGSYLAYLKIAQDLDRWAQLDQNAQQATIGRNKDDGSRLDLPGNTNFEAEGDFTDNTCPVTAHVRKAGPRGELHDHTKIFRRGLPFVDLQADGSIVAGLQFVSFQNSLDAFATILHRWMLNEAFPQPGTGQDALLEQQILKFLKGAFYFVPPHDDRYIAAGVFDAVVPRCRNVGRVIIRKHVVDANGNAILAELGGIGFQIFQGDNAITDVFHTNSDGHAISPDVPIGPELSVREVEPLPNFTPAQNTPITLDCPRKTIHITNTVTQPVSGYGG